MQSEDQNDMEVEEQARQRWANAEKTLMNNMASGVSRSELRQQLVDMVNQGDTTALALAALDGKGLAPNELAGGADGRQ